MTMFFNNRLRFIFLVLVCLTVTAGCREQHITVQINADGTCAVTTDSVFSRVVIKQQINRMAAYIKMSGQKIEGLDPGLFEESDKDKNDPVSDGNSDAEEERMEKQIRALYGMFYARSPDISMVEITAKNVRIQTKTEYPGLVELFEDPQFAYNLGYEGIRLETRDKGSAVFTMYRDPSNPNELKQSLVKLSSQNFSGSIKFILPGDIVETSLDHIEDHTTWSAFDPADEKLAARQIAALDEAVIMSFEPGVLSRSGILDSRESSQLVAEAKKIGGGIPLTPQSDGYLAETLSVTTTRIIPFAGRQAFSNKLKKPLSNETEGITVHARLYAPEGRQFLAMHSLKVIHAIDNSNRALEIPDRDLSKTASNLNGMEQRSVGDQIDVALPLPLPGFAIKAIEAIGIEAETVTCGGWQSHRIEGASLANGKEFDIGDLFEGGKLIIKEYNAESAANGQMQLEVTGAGNPYELKFEMELHGQSLTTQAFEDADDGNKANLRKVRLSFFDYRYSQKKAEGHPDLIVQYPADMKREMVRFELSEIDLF